MITQNDIGEALAMLTGNAADKTPDPSEITLLAWMDYFRPFPGWDGDDLVAAVAMYCKQPRERMVQPADLGMVIKAFRADDLARMDPDDRAWAQGAANAQVRRDRYGFIDKSVPDDDDCPVEWTSEQRLSAYWAKIDRHREQQEYEQAVGRPDTLLRERPADWQERAAAVAAFANRQLVIDEEDAADPVPYVNVVLVVCPFCKASTGEPCVTGRERTRLTGIIGHPSRITAAALAQGYTQEQAEALTADHQVRQTVQARTVWRGDGPTPIPPAPTNGVGATPVDTSAERGAQIAASGEYTSGEDIPPEPEPEAIAVPGGWRDEQGKMRFPDTETLDREWVQRQDRLFGEDR